MESRASDPERKLPVKIVVAGGFGVGKTTFVGAISEIEPLRSEAVMTQVSEGVDVPGQHQEPPWRWTSDGSS